MAQHTISHADRGASLRAVAAAIQPSQRTREALLVTGREMGLTALLVIGYFLIRGARPDNVALSVRNSLAVAQLEQRLGILEEPAWQQAVLGHGAVIKLAGIIYVWGMYPVLLGAGIWLCFVNVERFRLVRRVLLISAVIGIVCYWAIPQAPPRLMAVQGHDLGIVDTIHGSSSSSLRDLQPGPFLNLYAAQPSFHFAWMLLAAIAVATTVRRRWMWLLVTAFCMAMWWAIVVTGNHYFLDMVAGVLVVGVAWLLATHAAQWWLALYRGPAPLDTGLYGWASLAQVGNRSVPVPHNRRAA